MGARADRILVDGRMLDGEGTGVATYARTLIAAIERGGRRCGLVRAERPVGPARRLLRALSPSPLRLDARGDDLVGRDPFRLAHRRFALTGRLLRLRAPDAPPGIVHWTYPVPIRLDGWRNIYTIHDVIPLTHPALSPIDPRRHARVLAAVARGADRIVTVSAAARAAIVATLGCPPALVVDAGSAVLPPPAAAAAIPGGRAARSYFAFCGRIEPRKNLLRLIAAHAASGTGRPLLLAGPVVDGGAAVLDAVAAHPGVAYLGYLPRDALAALLGGARALLFPSLGEGFGLPVAEAMTAGVPALISRDPALREVAGGAAVEVEADDVAGMAAAIARLATDDALCAGLVARGRARAAAFTLDAFAARLDRLYATR